MVVSEDFYKINDHSIAQRTNQRVWDDANWTRDSTLCREFNFQSRQVTVTNEAMVWKKAGNEPAVGTSTFVQNFSDIEGRGEIERAHAKLIELGGAPPALEDIFGAGKKPARLPTAD